MTRNIQYWMILYGNFHPILDQEHTSQRMPCSLLDVSLTSSISLFMKHDVNKAFAKVIGKKVNRGAGYGLETLCEYHLCGPKPYIDKMKKLVDSLTTSGLA